MITIATQCDDRKAMVRRLSEHLQTPAVYLYTPTYAFRIGEITVNRDASVSGEREALLPAAECLLENGYITLPRGTRWPPCVPVRGGMVMWSFGSSGML